MGCSCRGRSQVEYVWTSDDGAVKMTYDSEVQAKAKVLRKGGSYVEVNKG